MPRRLSTFTAGQIRTDAKEMLKKYTNSTITPLLWLNIMNRSVAEIHELAGLKDAPEYKTNLLIPQSKSYKQVKDDGHTGTSYTASGRILVVHAIASIYWTNDADGFDSSWVGARVVLSIDNSGGGGITVDEGESALASPGGSSSVFVTTIESVTNATTVVLAAITGNAPPDIANAALKVEIAVTSSTASIIDIGSMNEYKYIDRIDKITSSTKGLCIELGYNEFEGINEPSNFSPNYADQIVWTRYGEYLYFAKGSLVTDYGIRTMYYTRLPEKVTVGGDLLDLKDSMINTLMDMIMLKALQVLNQPIPQELMGFKSKLKDLRSSSFEEKPKTYKKEVEKE